MGKKHQPVSRYYIVIILLFLATIGGLSFVYWQNFMQPNTDVDIVVPTENNSDLIEIAFTPKLDLPLSFSYPSSWVFDSEVVDNNTKDNMYEPISQKISIDSSAGIYVALDATDDFRGGGVCRSDDMSYYYEFFKSTPIPGDLPYYYIEAIINFNGVLSFSAYLETHRPNFSDIEMLSKSACVGSGTRDYGNPYRSDREDPNNGGTWRTFDGLNGGWRAHIHNNINRDDLITSPFYPYDDTEIAYSSVDEIKQLFASDDFQKAKAILLSVKTIK